MLIQYGSMSILYDSSGKKITLGHKLGTGGEGSVYDIKDQRDYVAKVYHKKISPQKAAKLHEMVQSKTDKLLSLAAWPVDTLHSSPKGETVGFIMPKIYGYLPIHELYSPKSRRTEFPHADWRFLIHTAANIARAFAAVHEHKDVIGDVNHGNIVVAPNGIVRLIDCDSFQIAANNGQIYFCEVGVAEYTAPELLGANFASTPRTENHDTFGLAVILFHLLFMGRHPFAGTYTGKEDMPIAKAIKEYRFAYGPQGLLNNMKQPPHTLPLSAVSPQVARLFESAFSRQAPATGRPTAIDWMQALDTMFLQTRVCSNSMSHYFLNTLSKCPWCELEQKIGIELFIAVPVVATAAGGFDINACWSNILQVLPPSPAPIPEIKTVLPSKKAIGIRRGKFLYRITTVAVLIAITGISVLLFPAEVAGVLFLVGVVLAGAFFSTLKDKANEFDQELKTIENNWNVLLNDWNKHCAEVVFTNKVREYGQLKDEYKNLYSLRAQEYEKLKLKVREHQLQKYLERFRVFSADIDSVGPERRTMLLSYGIETAADATKSKVMKVPGFGKALTAKVLDWRKACESGFVFDNRKGVDQQDVIQLDQRINSRRQQLETSLKNAVANLGKLKRNMEQHRQKTYPKLQSAALQYMQARSDAEFVHQGLF
jgi:DNA-binding helix-hairpin-helix protein with protein kinase domain